MVNIRLFKTTEFIKRRIRFSPEILIILGSGLVAIADVISVDEVISYCDIPYFKKTTVRAHKGSLIFDRLSKKRVIVMDGRLHRYEGYELSDVVYPVRVAAKLGVKDMLTNNLVGGINKGYKIGDFMVIKDHINLSRDNPLISYKETGKSRFIDMFQAYSPRLINLIDKAAVISNIKLRHGILVYLTGPNFETRAELNFLKMMKADAVSWSIVPEVLAARQENLEVLGISCISDISDPDRFSSVDIDKIFQVGINKADEFARLLKMTLPPKTVPLVIGQPAW